MPVGFVADYWMLSTTVCLCLDNGISQVAIAYFAFQVIDTGQLWHDYVRRIWIATELLPASGGEALSAEDIT